MLAQRASERLLSAKPAPAFKYLFCQEYKVDKLIFSRFVN